ncbi:interleukin-23 receptor-like isoform X1 [Polyodon spathula]|uniref:interleukin-23 receptor-like isoform X1 n=1 Tax=Polyodon spathula TaxID=7913 RepID=UPI001B7E18D5|nr:interleukin-23 receptor-like isoform X1 [Polyodon spathula]XP_041073725.1 interleukin-23 receptor-like isoform X1 [Polyodon spathula]
MESFSRRFAVVMGMTVLLYWNSGGCSGLVCRGILWVEPTPVFSMGSSVSVVCTSSIENCHPEKFSVYLNNNPQPSLHHLNHSAVELQLHITIPHSAIRCHVKCKGQRGQQMVCGKDIKGGYPPDNPTNFTCISKWNSNTISCTWKKGKATYINTSYIVEFQSSERIQTFSPQREGYVLIPLSHFELAAEYNVSVRARNHLGQSQSAIIQLTINDVVIPDTPTITNITFVNGSHKEAVLQWNKSVQLCAEVRYRAAVNVWTMVEEKETSCENSTFELRGLKPFTQYEFQIRSCKTNEKLKCSGWSPSFLERTPEAEPCRRVDVWRIMGPTHSNGSRTVTILWKPLAPKYSRGIILGYEVFYREYGKQRHSHLCQPNKTQCQITLPKHTKMLYITALNSKGSSEAAQLSIGQKEFAPPIITKLVSADSSRILLAWKAPSQTKGSVLWYIAEWHRHDGSMRWKKVTCLQNSTYIEAKVSGSRYHISLYAIYSNGESKPATAEAYSKELEPRAGPKVSVVETQKKRALIKWEDIPVHLQRGFIKTYTIYLKKGTDETYFRNVSVALRQYWLESLEPAALYTVYMTAWNSAGKGAKGEEIILKLAEGYDFTILMVIVVVVTSSIAIPLIVMFCNSIRHRIKRIFILWVPEWVFEEFPRVENSSVVKLLQEKYRTDSDSLWLSLLSDPPVTEVEETIFFSEEVAALPSLLVDDTYAEGIEWQCAGKPEAEGTPSEHHGYQPQVSNQGEDQLFNSVETFQPELLNTSSPADCGIFTMLLNGTFDISSRSLLPSGDINVTFGGKSQIIDLTGFRGKRERVEFNERHDFPTEDSDQGQTLLPDALVDCLRHSTQEPVAVNSYFPQLVVRPVTEGDC